MDYLDGKSEQMFYAEQKWQVDAWYLVSPKSPSTDFTTRKRSRLESVIW